MKWVVPPALALMSACAAPAPPQPSPTALPTALPTATPVVVRALEPASVPQVNLPVPTLRPNALASPVPLPLSIIAGRNGADVRVTLDLLLQEQVYLLGAAQDASTNARLDELIGASNALDQNSLAIAQLIGAARGQSAAVAVVDALRGYTSDLLHANPDLDRRISSLAKALAISEDTLRQRTQALRSEQLDAALATSDAIGRPLAVAISKELPAQAPPPIEGRDVDARLDLARALLTRVYVNGALLAAAAAGRPTDAAATDVNADEIGQQLAAVWGADISNGVSTQIRTENAALLSVASGGDRGAAATTLDRTRAELDGVLAGANPLLPPGLLGQQLRASDQPLLTAADGFVARDYLGAYTRLREAARQSQKPATTLALAMVDRYPARYLVLPTPMPEPLRQ